ncbi:MAG: metal-sulfur cluster assembly factor [Clostridiales bacterium]|nr:metal-sulfur cluster assembly factor [Clostridiales bacterium]
MTSSVANEDQVMEALSKVIDPELGMNIVELGLVYDVTLAGKYVQVTMTLTTPGCPLGFVIDDEVRRVLTELGFEEVDVNIVFDPPWTPDRMSDEAKIKLGFF